MGREGRGLVAATAVMAGWLHSIERVVNTDIYFQEVDINHTMQNPRICLNLMWDCVWILQKHVCCTVSSPDKIHFNHVG